MVCYINTTRKELRRWDSIKENRSTTCNLIVIDAYHYMHTFERKEELDTFERNSRRGMDVFREKGKPPTVSKIV